MKNTNQLIGGRRNAAATSAKRDWAPRATHSALCVLWLAVLPMVVAQPANDNFADRIAITGANTSVTGSNVGATKEPGEPNHAGWSGGASVWWSWEAPAAATATFDTIGSGFSTVVAVYTGTVVSNLTPVASAAQSGSTNGYYYSRAGFVPTAGVEYQVAVDTEWGDTNNVVLNVATGVPIITVQPQTQGVSAGSNATFSVTALGDPPLSYQWLKNGDSIADATSSVLTLTNVQIAEAATYSVIVSNSLGSVTSVKAVLSLPVPEPYFFTTIAGKPRQSGSVDGTGDVARFTSPVAVALDSAGNLFVAEIHNHTIRKVAPLGTNWLVSTVAGTAGASGFVDATNSDARFYLPNGVAVDSAGTLYVSDLGNGAVRRIVPDGTNWVVSTIATGFSRPGGCAVDSAGNVYVADISRGRVHKIALTGGSWVVTLVASGLVALPDRVAVDAATNLYVSAAAGSAIYKITPSGPSWIVSTLAGYSGSGGPAVDGTNSGARFDHPEGVAVDSAGSVYVGDYWNSTIRKITPAGVTTTLAGLGSAFGSADGAGSAARFAYPNGVAVDSHGTVYVADELNTAIRMGWPIVQMQPPSSVPAGQVQTQGFGISVSLASGLNYDIQASSNLITWSELTNFSPPGLTFSFLDEDATNCPQRFYRVVGP